MENFEKMIADEYESLMVRHAEELNKFNSLLDNIKSKCTNMKNNPYDENFIAQDVENMGISQVKIILLTAEINKHKFYLKNINR